MTAFKKIATCVALSVVACRVVSSSVWADTSESSQINLAPLVPIDESLLDTRLNPCDDIYAYACGKWISEAKIPGDKPYIARTASPAEAEVHNVLKQVLDNYSRGIYQPSIENAAQLGAYYKACKDGATGGSELVLRDFQLVDEAFKDSSEKGALTSVIAEMISRGTPAFFDIVAVPDSRNARTMMAEIRPAGLSLPKRYYKTWTVNPIVIKVRSKFETYVKKMFILAGFDSSTAAREAARVVTFEKKLSESMSSDILPDPEKNYHPTQIDKLQKRVPAIAWRDLFSHLQIGNGVEPVLSITEPKYLASLQQIFTRARVEDLRTYLRWQILHQRAGIYGKGFSDLQFSLFGKEIAGLKQRPPRDEECLNQIEANFSGSLSEALGHAISVGPKEIASAERLFEEIRTTFGELLRRHEWMDEQTRNTALEKLAKMRFSAGYPKTHEDLTGLELTPDSYYLSVDRLSRFQKQMEMRKIGRPTDNEDWSGVSASNIYAAYIPEQNRIIVPAAFLRPPLFYADAPLAQQLGTFGFIIGHELTHGFDTLGSKYDSDGNFSNWWSKSARKAFMKRASCLTKGFMNTSSERTLGETIADLGGLKLAYLTYERLIRDGKVSAASSSHEMPWEQQVMISATQMACFKLSKPYEVLISLMDSHALPSKRVRTGASHTQQVGTAFGCKAGDRMAPTHRCEVW